jgi:hypothetical protein
MFALAILFHMSFSCFSEITVSRNTARLVMTCLEWISIEYLFNMPYRRTVNRGCALQVYHGGFIATKSPGKLCQRAVDQSQFFNTKTNLRAIQRPDPEHGKNGDLRLWLDRNFPSWRRGCTETRQDPPRRAPPRNRNFRRGTA